MQELMVQDLENILVSTTALWDRYWRLLGWQEVLAAVCVKRNVGKYMVGTKSTGE